MSSALKLAVLRESEWLDAAGIECYKATLVQCRPATLREAIHRPFLDEHHLAVGGSKPTWPGGAPFAVCLTHDVDHVSARNTRMHWRQLRNYCHQGACIRSFRAARGARASAASLSRSLLHRSSPDPMHCYERWLQLETAVGARSTFLFLPERYAARHYTDGVYRYGDEIVFDGQACSVGEMMREMHHRGWEVGLHASWGTCNSVDEILRQKEQVERIIDAPVTSVRHHYLHFDIRRTPRVHDRAGFLVDSSLGFNDDIGFRFGTSYPWHLPGDMQRFENSALQLPLTIQDKCLIRHIAQEDEGHALRTANAMIDRVETVGGVLTLLWHPCTIRHSVYVRVYERLLSELRQRNAWFGTMAEITRWWLKENSQ